MRISDYLLDHRPIFPFTYCDEFLFSVRGLSLSDTNRQEVVFDATLNQAGTETELEIPTDVQALLTKGPNYRVPPNLSCKAFLSNVHKQLDRVKYNVRWNDKFDTNASDNKLSIPFSKNTVFLPPKMCQEKENKLQYFKDKALEIITKEAKLVKNKKNYKQDTALIQSTRQFLTENAVKACSSDKTNRFVISKCNSLMKRTENLLNDTSSYSILENDNINKIENQANALIRKTCNNTFSKSDLERLLATGSNAAQFHVKVKDHKDKTDENCYPLRPIASSINTPTSKVDWLVTKIIGQLIQFVHTNIKNSLSLIEDLKQLNVTDRPLNTFISLDVINICIPQYTD